MSGRFAYFSCQKFSSPVVEAILSEAASPVRQAVLTELCSPLGVVEMTPSMFAPYVIRKALAVSTKEEQRLLAQAFQTHMNTNDWRCRTRWERIFNRGWESRGRY